jgi:CheY-like chemotaxis protein
MAPTLAHCLYVESNLDTIESSKYLETCAALHFTGQTFSFLVATDAFRALEFLSQKDFSCIFLHRELPGLNAVDALRILKTAQYKNGIVLVVEQQDGITHEDAVKLGFVSVLRKPFSSLQLCEAVAACVPPCDDVDESGEGEITEYKV